ncbi:MAG: YidC/Oxa1 family membrane protein insertase [Coriobacteriia bacterium]|nr:YidC/Oxa1 family membrane protein insertase [Coriobacteriia bacterium]
MRTVLDPLINVLGAALDWFYGLVGDYGVAIILLTVVLRVLMIPLTWKQTKSMYEMQRIQPKIKALQQKYKNDKQKLQEETLKFYQENKVNPFGGCLPLLLQLPIFFALFSLLRNLDAGRFWIIIPDLTSEPRQVYAADGLLAALPYLILVGLFALSVWLPQRLMPGEKQQQQIGLYMSVFMLYFGWISPAGVLLYWVTSSAWQVAQQVVTIKYYSSSEGAK